MSLPTVPIPNGAPTPDSLTERLPEYEEFRCIGAGAMGVVYEAFHRPLQRQVALKVLSPNLITHGLTVKRFFQEARAMARISHQNIVPVYEVAGESELPFFTMELVVGGSLKDRIARDGMLAPRESAKIARDLAAALHHAHEAGILHRDVKPGNVLIDHGGSARLTDFGLVRRTDSATLTASDAIVGTPQYMSPEQVKGTTLDGRSDMFSLGTTVYEMLTGRPPFQAESPVSVLRAIVDQQPPSIRKLRPQVPAGLEAVVMRMLEKDAQRRYPDLRAAQDDLERYLNGEAVEATLPSNLTRSWRRLRSNRLALRFAVATTILATAGAAYIYITETTNTTANIYGSVINEASIRLKQGDWEEAQTALTQLDEEQRQRPEVLILYAQIAWRGTQKKRAFDYIDQALEADPGRREYLELGVGYAIEAGSRRGTKWLVALEGLPANQPGTASEKQLRALGMMEVQLWRSQAENALLERDWHLRPSPDMPQRILAMVAQVPLAQRAKATLAIGYGMEALRECDEYIAKPKLDWLYQTELANLHFLRSLLETDEEQRLESLRQAYSAIGLANLREPFMPEVLRGMMAITGLLAALEQGETSDRLQRDFERAESMYATATNVLDIARNELEDSFSEVIAPAAKPVAGPLGRFRDAMGDMLGGILGSGEEPQVNEPQVGEE